LLGGLVGQGATNLASLSSSTLRKTIGGYFYERLRSPFTFPAIQPSDFISKPNEFNAYIPENIDLIAGDGLIELQASSISNVANTPNAAVVNPWAAVMSWLEELLVAFNGNSYDYVFLDTNPSFSAYTQIAIASAQRLIVPVMADDSSRRALQNLFALVYGIGIPASVSPQVLFPNNIASAGKILPNVHMVVKNNLTQYMGEASAYGAILRNIRQDVANALRNSPQIFTFNSITNGLVDVMDFHSTGVVSFAEGCPFFSLTSGLHLIAGQRIQLNADYIEKYRSNIETLSRCMI
jgi:cellulose biosynthesis protein BcsQ